MVLLAPHFSAGKAELLEASPVGTLLRLSKYLKTSGNSVVWRSNSIS
jgi:hypothetical protein